MSNEKIYGVCYVCNSELFGTVIEVAGRHYHNRCFYCCKCRKQLGKEEFRMRDERFFCIGCYSKTFERICAECGSYITDDRYIEALKSFYHVDHFVCFLCKNSFPDNRFVKKEIFFKGEQRTCPFCIECHQKVKKMECSTCHNPLGYVKAFDGKDFYHDFCWLRDHPEEDESGALTEDAHLRFEEEEKSRRAQEEQRRIAEEKKRLEEEMEKKSKQEEERRRIEQERMKEREERARKEEEKRKREEEERKRNEEISRERDEEKRRRDEDRQREIEEKEREREEEKKRREEEKKQREEEERKQEEERRKQEEEKKKRQNERNMAESYRTQSRQVNFYDTDDFTNVVKEAKVEKVIPSVPSVPVQAPVYKPNSVMDMLKESYRPMKIDRPVETIDESSEDTSDDSVDEVPQQNVMDDEYRKEQERVRGLPKEQLAKYPFEVLISKNLPKDVDPARKEYHLTEEEFKKVFNMDLNTYESLIDWKKKDLRKKSGLF